MVNTENTLVESVTEPFTHRSCYWQLTRSGHMLQRDSGSVKASRIARNADRVFDELPKSDPLPLHAHLLSRENLFGLPCGTGRIAIRDTWVLCRPSPNPALRAMARRSTSLSRLCDRHDAMRLKTLCQL